MPPGLDALKHIVVLMMENRPFDHMLGALAFKDNRIDGLKADMSNPDTTGAPALVRPIADYQSQLDPDPGHHFEDVRTQIWGFNPGEEPMKGFVRTYYQKQQNVAHSRQIMYYFTPDKLPVLTTLARNYLVFNAWFSSLPGPTVPNRAFAHFGTSFGKTDNSIFYLGQKYPSIYERMRQNGRTAKIYYYDEESSTIGLAFLLLNQPDLFGTFDEFLAACKNGNLPDYSFIEPNYKDHEVDAGEAPASDQHPDHNVKVGEQFIQQVYQAIRGNKDLWPSTALLITYDEHGGIFDHVNPPACPEDEFTDDATGFKFDRLGVRVPAILVSPWVEKGGVVPSDRVFDHASIPGTVTEKFIGPYDARSPREKNANTFLDLLSLDQMRNDPDVLKMAGLGTHGLTGAGIATLEAAAAPVANPQRPLAKNSLLQDQVQHFHEAEMQLPPDQQTHWDIDSIQSEADAAAYVKAVTQAFRARKQQ
jgi:phospholipase C